MLGDNRRQISLSDCRIMAQHADGYNEQDLWVVRLQTGIVKQAVADLRAAIRVGRTASVAALVKWFRSEWGQLLCLGSGEYIVEKVMRDEAKKEDTERHERRFHY